MSCSWFTDPEQKVISNCSALANHEQKAIRMNCSSRQLQLKNNSENISGFSLTAD
jgi:hypothetical protein